jgi:orotate phosphoribosyltransferase
VNDDLVRRIVDASELHGEFVLSSGRTSTVYFDKFRFLSDPALLRDLAHAVTQLVPPDVTTLAAPEGAAMLLVAAVALQTGLPLAIVRKQAKEYGTRARVEGQVGPGSRIALLEDVSTTGRQVREAAEALAAEGATIDRIILAIDRGGADHLRDAGYTVDAIAMLRPEG